MKIKTKLMLMLTLTASLITLNSIAHEWPQQVEVFYDSDQTRAIRGADWAKRNGIAVVLSDLNAIQRIEQELNSQITGNSETSIRHLQQEILKLAPARIKDITQSAEARQRARELQVQVLPSVVINQRYLIADTNDVRAAIYEWRRFSHLQP